MTDKPVRVALVHDWLTGMRGGEYVLEAIAGIFPRAELFTLLYVPGRIAPDLTVLRRHTSALQKFPKAEHRYRYFLPLMPWLAERFDLSGYDLVISNSHCVAKGVKKAPGAVHVSYVLAPMRYMWDRFDDYFGPGRSSPPVRWAAGALRARIQAWDRRVSGPDRVDELLTLSQFIAGQIQSAYGRDAKVIYPFADLERFAAPRKPGRGYLMVSAFAPYKRIDLAVEAFNRLKLPLYIVGSGQDSSQLKKLAGPTIEFLGPLSNSAIADLYSKCRAFIFPGKEDFGITPVEAMAAGAPVIAFGEGGATETVTEKTGMFFSEPTAESLVEAVQRFERGDRVFTEEDCRKRAAEFTRSRFEQEFAHAVRAAWSRGGKESGALESVMRI